MEAAQLVIIKIRCSTRVCAGSNFIQIYTIPLRRHGVQYHLYADDTQLYVSFKVGDVVDLLKAQRRIEMCIAEIKAGMVMFMLKLNDDKTELVIIAPPYFLHHNKVPLSSDMSEQMLQLRSEGSIKILLPMFGDVICNIEQSMTIIYLGIAEGCPHDALKHHFTSLKTGLIFLQIRAF